MFQKVSKEVVISLVKAFIFAYSILGVELTLYWNGATDVYSIATTGQLIPFT
ncbi:hypothetical protein C8A03DRAFT_38407, partial [Achaetomium macrosporum]